MVDFSEQELAELRRLASEVRVVEEAGVKMLCLLSLRLPPGCEPGTVDALFYPLPRAGYDSRLYFSCEVKGAHEAPKGSAARPNWQAVELLCGRSWHVYSWKPTVGPVTLTQIISSHLKALQ